MDWQEHWDLVGKHAFLSPSQYHWVNDDLKKLETRYFNYEAKKLGTELHEYAATAIRLRRKQPRNNDTVNRYINDALGFRMRPEQPLYFSRNCFGTADAISFERSLLRIHDLKTGTVPANKTQVDLYEAIFCLEYMQDPHEIDSLLRIYQNNEIEEWSPDPDYISDLMTKIREFDAHLERLRSYD